jgi:pimeloyl-ACP methyl ester carboxylesterase
MKTSILLLPGLLCDAALWAHQVEALSTQYDCVVADMTQDDSLGGMASRAIAAMSEQFSVAGLSMGGYCALEIMKQVPDRVTRLALLDTSARADASERLDIRRELIEHVRSGNFETVIAKHFQKFVHPSRLNDTEIMSIIRASAMNVGPEAYMRQQAAIMKRPDSLELLSDIKCPTLVLCGAEDALTPPPLHDEMAAEIPGAVLVKIPNSGHLPTLEQPALVNAALAKWMERT